MTAGQVLSRGTKNPQLPVDGNLLGPERFQGCRSWPKAGGGTGKQDVSWLWKCLSAAVSCAVLPVPLQIIPGLVSAPSSLWREQQLLVFEAAEQLQSLH